MKKLVSKVTAGLLAAALIAGAAPADFGQLDLFAAAPVTAYAEEYTSLQQGDVIHLGDAINSTTEYESSDGFYLVPDYRPFTLVRGDINGWVIAESENGNYYFLKDSSDDYYGFKVSLGGYDGGYWPVTDTSDGLVVTSVVTGDYYPVVTFAVHEAPAAPTIYGPSVTLGDDLALNIYVDGIANDTEAAEYTMNFTGACVDSASALSYNAAAGKYYATTHVYAKNIDKYITATLCKGSDTVDTLENYSITQYLSSSAFSGADEKTTALITATKDFGNASSEYFYGTGSGYSDGFASYNPNVSAYATTFSSDDALLSLVLDSKTAARLYVKGDITGTESTINATKAEYPTYHEVAGLLPQNLADEQTITVGSTVYKFSALSWCNRVLNSTSASPKNVNMAKAIMAYYTAAKAYTTVDVASVAITNAPTEAITVGNTGTLTATVSPDNATNKTVTWAVTEGTDVLSIDAATGEYEALKAGTAKVTATADGKTAECTITVMPENKETLTLSHTTGTYFGLTASSTNSSGWRMYGGSTINISSTNGKTIKKVELTIAGYGNSRNLNNFAVSSGTKTANGTTAGCIVTISDVNATTLTLTDNNSNAAKQYIFNKAVIYFE